MEDSEENMSSDDVRKNDSQSGVKKPKKRSLVERELETSLTARVTSPASASEGLSTSRYGRARRLKTDTELIESQKVLLASIKPPGNEKSSVKVQSPTYRMHASNSPQKAEDHKNPPSILESQIDNIYQENASLSRFSEDSSSQSPAKKFPKVYTRKDLIQNREEDEPIMLISNLFSPAKSSSKSKTPLSNSVSTEKYCSKQNGHVDNSSVVKTLDFDGKKKKKDDKNKESKPNLSKNELFELEAQCPFQVGDLAWARMGTFPFWPCIVTRDPQSEMFVKKKMFGRVEHYIIHVTFFGDNGRRSWLVDNMLRNYLGLTEFETARDKFTAEEKKKDPRLYAAFFISEKKQVLWKSSVEEAESLLREPKRLRIDLFNDMLWNARLSKKNQKGGKIISRTNSDVSLSESLYDSLFSEPEEKTDDAVRAKNRSRNKSFDVSEVVTACLDNMAAKTGITKIQRQSHMDRWLQKAKSKTPEKNQTNPVLLKVEKPEQTPLQESKSQPKTTAKPIKLNRKPVSKAAKFPITPQIVKPYRFRRRTESNPTLAQPCEVQTDFKIEEEGGKLDNKNKNIDLNPINMDVTTETSPPDNGGVITIDDDSCDIALPKKEPPTAPSQEAIENDKTEPKSIEESPTNNINKIHDDSAMSVDDDCVDVSQSKNEVNTKHNISKGIEEVTQASYPGDKHKSAIQNKFEISCTTNDKLTDNADLSLNDSKTETDSKTQDILTKEEKSGNGELKSPEIKMADKTISLKTHIVTSNNADKIDTTKPAVVDEALIKNDQVSSDLKIEANINDTHNLKDQSKAISTENNEDSVMAVDNDSFNYGEIQENQTDKSIQLQEPKNQSVIEVKGNTDCEMQTNGNKRPNSKTVSNKSVDNQILMACTDTNFKDARNVTIEVSVTEKKNDDTLNNQLHEDQQGSIDGQTLYKDSVTNFETSHFLDELHSPKDNMKKNSTPEKNKEYDTPNAQISESCTNILNFDMTTNINISNMKLPQNDSNYTDNNEQEETDDDKIIDDYSSLEEENNILNESTQSESILLCDDSVLKNDKNVSDMSPKESNKSNFILDHSQTDSDADKSILDTDKTDENLENELSVAEDNKESCFRHYVESPTFTQTQDSEEFFREVTVSPKLESNNGKKGCAIVMSNPHDNEIDSKNVSDNNVQKQIQNKDMISSEYSHHNQTFKQPIKEREKDSRNVENEIGETFEEYSEETSDDEPSPAYESLDEEITEDFRKHMQSIESNIKDKKDEDQIVKICNEIAEKAKLSPTKYVPDEQVTKQVDTKVKKTPTTNLSNKIKNVLKDKVVSEPQTDGNHLSSDNKDSIKLQDSKDVDIESQNFHKTHKRVTRHSKDSKPKVNGSATLKEIADSNKPEIVYKTRRSLSNTTKDLSPLSTGFKIKATKIEQYRKSSEYAPKVLLTRLEKDQWCCHSQSTNETHFSINDKMNQHNSHIENTVKTPKKTSTNAELITRSEGRIKANKSRLSLKRQRGKRHQSETITDEPKQSLVQDSLKVKVVKTTNEVPTKLLTEQSETKDRIETHYPEPKIVNIKSISKDTSNPESVKVNGYHLEVNRKLTATPESGDTDFDIDAVSLNSEDSELSLSNSEKSLPVRNLRSRPERCLEYALRNPEFLQYLELKQDYLMDEHPELNEDEIITYVYKTWQYEQDLKSDIKKVEDARQANLSKSLKSQETPRSHKKKTQPKNIINKYFHEKYEKSKKTIDFTVENGSTPTDIKESNIIKTEEIKLQSEIPVQTGVEDMISALDIPKMRSISPECIDITSDDNHEVSQTNDTLEVKIETLQLNNSSASVSALLEENKTPTRRSRRSNKPLTPTSIEKQINTKVTNVSENDTKKEKDFDTESVDSEDSEIPVRRLRPKLVKESFANNLNNEISSENQESNSESNDATKDGKFKKEVDETASTVSDNEPLVKQKKKKFVANSIEDPEFLNYLKQKQDALMDENPQLTEDEIVSYLHKTWLYEESSKSELVKTSEQEEANLIKGLNNNEVAPAKKHKKRSKVEKQTEEIEIVPKDKPRRRIAQPFYNENYSDIEEELELFEIFKTKKTPITLVTKADTDKNKVKSPSTKPIKDTQINKSDVKGQSEDVEEIQNTTEVEGTNAVQYFDDTEIYFTDLTKPKPNVFKGLAREKVCEICEYAGHLVKCKGCHGTFHPDCVKREQEAKEKEKKIEALPRGRKKKIKKAIRKTKSFEDSGSHSDEKQDVSADVSMEEITIPEITFDAESFESQLELKMKELLKTPDLNYDSYSSDDGIDWRDTEAGKCEIIDVKWKRRDAPIDYSDFKCFNCQKYDTPICYVCKNAVSKTGVKLRQKCNVAHCHKYYHLECLVHWPQTQFNSGEPSRHNRKISEHFEAITCPRHVCHTCVSDDPRGCKTRFSGDKLAKCVRCPATYHSFNKCLPAGSQVLTASHIICPRHCDHRPGKVPCHVNTGWCFICAQGGSLICCEYCPTSFHAECLNIKPPEGNYMCEDCETGRLPLYGEMVWVKLGHYRWWPGIILHPSEIPDNIMAVKHEPGDFVVRFFGQYDHYWVNRGRVFPYQEGDSGRISSQKSKINEDFICAIEHAQRAYNILKNAEPDEEESLDIESSLLPPHYVKLKCNKPCGSLCGKRTEDPSLSLTQCECDPADRHPCGPYSHCLNRMLLTECGPTCRAGERCMNRAFEKRQYPKLVPYRTPHRGWGLKTLEDIKAGQFVIEYVGELIDEEEFRRRMRRKHEIRDENFYFLTLDKERMIDAGPKGNVARFMNHCCEPNCETQKWTVLGDVRVGLFAIDDIPANSEVTFNYNLECAGIEKKRCLCGAKRCSGYIGAKPKQDESQTKKTKRPYNKKKKPEESPSTKKIRTKRLGRPSKPKELTELEKDVLIIKNATSSISSEDSTKSLDEDKMPKPLKRKRVSNATDEMPLPNNQDGIEEKHLKSLRNRRVSVDDIQFSKQDSTNDKIPKPLKRKRISLATEEVTLSSGQEQNVKKLKCEEKPSEVGD